MFHDLFLMNIFYPPHERISREAATNIRIFRNVFILFQSAKIILFLICSIHFPDFRVIEQEDFVAVVVEADAGFQTGRIAGDFEDVAETEPVVFDPLSGFQFGDRSGDEIRVAWRAGRPL